MAAKKSTTHGMTRSPTHNTWSQMLQRCRDPKCKEFPRYGGRGIRVCARWTKFQNFLADMGERPSGKTLDRKNNNRNYCKSNCRWATQKQQMRNTRMNHRVEFRGQILTLAEWSERLGIKNTTLAGRLNRGWPIDKVFVIPVAKKFRNGHAY